MARGRASRIYLVYITSLLCACRTAPLATAPAPAAPAAAATPAPIDPTPPRSIDVAVTFDDLPRCGPEVPGRTRLQIHQQILTALQKHHVPQVYGFVNGRNLALHPEDRPALEAWVEAGYPLGSHTYSHLGPVDLPAYLDDIDRNEPLLRELMPGPEERWKVFRYPFLMQGQSRAERALIRTRLAARGYRIAEVSIDFGDWAWNEPYARCLQRGDSAAIDELKASFLESASTFLAFDDALARRVYGRRIPHVLLLHVGAFDALMLDDLLELYQRAGVRFVPLDAALADPAYRADSGVAPTRGDILQEQAARARGTGLLPSAQKPFKALDAVCRGGPPAWD